MDERGRELFNEALPRFAQRAAEWELIEPQIPKSGAELQAFIGLAAPQARDAFGVHLIAEKLYDLIFLGFAAPHLTAEDWANDGIVRYLRFARLDGAILLRAMSNICEKHDIPSTALTQLAFRWGTHWREHSDPKDALISFEKSFEHEQLIKDLAESTARVLRRTEPDAIAIQLGYAKDAASATDVEEPVGVKPPAPVEPPSPRVRRCLEVLAEWGADRKIASPDFCTLFKRRFAKLKPDDPDFDSMEDNTFRSDMVPKLMKYGLQRGTDGVWLPADSLGFRLGSSRRA